MDSFVSLVVGFVLIGIGLVFVFRPNSPAEYRDMLAPSSSVSGEFGAAVSLTNGVVFCLLGSWFLWRSFT